MAKDPAVLWQSTDGIGRHNTHIENKEGVYVMISYDAFTKKSTIIYVGRSLNLKERWKSHEVYNKAWKENHCPSVKWKYCNNSAELEAKLIRRFKPLYNKQLK